MIRPARPEDAPPLLALKLELDSQTPFVLVEPNEREETVDGVAQELRWFAGQDNATLLLAGLDGALVGYVEARGGRFRRNRHRAEVVIGVHAAVSGRGIGTALLHSVDVWSGQAGMARLELSVMASNERANRALPAVRLRA